MVNKKTFPVDAYCPLLWLAMGGVGYPGVRASKGARVFYGVGYTTQKGHGTRD